MIKLAEDIAQCQSLGLAVLNLWVMLPYLISYYSGKQSVKMRYIAKTVSGSCPMVGFGNNGVLSPLRGVRTLFYAVELFIW